VAARPAPPENAASAWRTLLAAGRYADAVRAAERLGFARVCATAGQDDLLALADAARLSGHSGHAIVVLTVLRQRFPNTSSASTAAFALGRIAFERRANYFDAAHWFATYLEEDPSGPLMGDAAGRLVEARYRAGDRSGARRDAERYLRRFPRGPYANTAIEILSE
jgi:transmembrane sensor